MDFGNIVHQLKVIKMRVYRLVHKDYNGEIVFGLPYPYNQLDGEKKVNYLFSKNKPWTHCVPYYKNCKFAFVSLSALITFLYWNGDLTEQETSDIENNFYVETFDLDVYSSGLSKFLCTYFDDEVISEIDRKELKDLKNETTKIVIQDPISDEDIKIVREDYYTNIKTYY